MKTKTPKPESELGQIVITFKNSNVQIVVRYTTYKAAQRDMAGASKKIKNPKPFDVLEFNGVTDNCVLACDVAALTCCDVERYKAVMKG